MVALTLAQAKGLGAALVAVLGIGAVGSAMVAKAVTQKITFFAILALLAALVWSQRAALDQCADKVKEAGAANVDTTCSFFGRDIEISAPRS